MTSKLFNCPQDLPGLSKSHIIGKDTTETCPNSIENPMHAHRLIRTHSWLILDGRFYFFLGQVSETVNACSPLPILFTRIDELTQVFPESKLGGCQRNIIERTRSVKLRRLPEKQA